MKSLKWLLLKRHYLYIAGLLFGAALLAGNGLGESRTSAQAANSLYVTPSSGTYNTGDSFTVSVRVNTTDQVNAVGANLTYGATLQFVSIDGAGSAFGVDASSSGGSGAVSISRASITPISGDQLVAKVTFKVLAAGTGTVNMQSNSQALSSSTNQDVITVRNGGSYSLQTPATPSPSPAPTPSPTPPSPSPSPTPVSSPSSTSSKGSSGASNQAGSSKAATTIAPQGNATTTPLPGGSAVELAAPATVETTPDPNKKVTKVEYRLNGKLVNTDTAPPYSHDIDTTKLRNGKYDLETKTYYENGTSDMSNASITVSNPFGLTQLWLQLRHYAWLIIILLIIAGELLYLKFFRNHTFGSGNTTGKGNGSSMAASGHGDIVVGGSSSPATIQPSATPSNDGPVVK